MAGRVGKAGTDRAKKKKPGKGIALVVVLLVLVAGGFWIYRTGHSTPGLEYARAEIGTVKHEQRVKAFFANEETLIYAPAGGEVEKLAVPGQRLRRGESAAKIKEPGGADQTVGVPAGGLILYAVDGLEGLWTAENFRTMELNKLLHMQSSAQDITTVYSGQAMGKMVNNLAPTTAFVELGSLDGLSLGKSLRFRMGDKIFSGKIIRQSDNPTGVVLEFNQYIDSSVEQRTQEMTWITKPEGKGIVVPRSALWTRGEEQGVFAVIEGVLHFRQVNVQDENETEAAVEGLPSGLLVVKNPESDLDGRPARLSPVLK